MSAANRGPEWQHLGELLEAVQRNAYFLHGAALALPWPLEPDTLATRRKDIEFFTHLSAFNERFGKLQDCLGQAMRHAALLAGEPVDRFLKVLAFFEKVEVLDNLATWQGIRLARNQAAHDYSVDDQTTAAHFNALREKMPALLGTAARLVRWLDDTLQVTPLPGHFVAEFQEFEAYA